LMPMVVIKRFFVSRRLDLTGEVVTVKFQLLIRVN